MKRMHPLLLASVLIGCSTQSGYRVELATLEPHYFFTADGDSIFFRRLTAIAVYDENRLVVGGQWGMREVWILNHSDNVGRRIGTSGQGPGEYSSPAGLDVSADTLLVYNFNPHRLIKYSLPDGYYISSYNIEGMLIGPTMAAAPAGGFYATTTERRPIDWLIAGFDISGEIALEFGERQTLEGYEERDANSLYSRHGICAL